MFSLTPRQLELKRREGALIVDVRTDQQFDDAHIAGGVCIPLMRAGFGSKLAWIADRDQEVVFVGRDDDGRRAVRLATAVELRKLAGFLEGGDTSRRQEGRNVERLPLAKLEDRLAEGDLQVLDVREHSEWTKGHFPGSAFKPWHDIDGVPEGIDPDHPVAAICGSGGRAAIAASLLQRYGAEQVVHVIDGGVPGWEALGRPIEQGSVVGKPEVGRLNEHEDEGRHDLETEDGP